MLVEIADHLDRVQAIYVEVHETDESIEYNSADRIEQILLDAGFKIETKSRYDEYALPEHLDSWRRSVAAKQTQLMGWR